MYAPVQFNSARGSADNSLWFIHHNRLVSLVDFPWLLDFDATLAHDVEVLSRQEDLVLPRL